MSKSGFLPRRPTFALSLLAGALLLSGCANMGSQPRPASMLGTAELPSQRAVAALHTQTTAWPTQAWWEAYGDARLTALVERARAHSPTVALAQARVRQATALEGLAESALGPQASLAVRSTRQHFSANSNIPRPLAGTWQWMNDASIGMSYEVDFWGKNAAAVGAAAGRVNAQQAEAQSAMLAVSVALVQVYLKLDQLYVQRDLAEQALQQRDALRALVARRVEARIDSNAELKQAEIGVPLARAQLDALDEAIAIAHGQIAALAGDGPDAGLAIGRPALKARLAQGAPADLPASLLGRRADLVALRWRVQAASGDIDVAKAQFYPTVNLGALVGLQSLGFGHLLESSSRSLGAGPLITLPLLDAGRLRSNLALRHADFDVAVEQYNAAVVEAMRDVVAQLTSMHWLGERRREEDAALDAAEQAWQLALLRYRSGVGNFLQVLVAQGQVIAQRRSRAELDARANELDLNLIRALGGGYAGLDAPARLAQANPSSQHH